MLVQKNNFKFIISEVAFRDLKKGKGGSRYPPYIFTEQGVAMFSFVLTSDRAIEVN